MAFERNRKVAVVTGANKGIGYGIVKSLCKQFDGDVILTARSESLGKAAVAELGKEGLHPKFYQVDLLDKVSMEKLKSYLASQYGGLDVLVNNAGIAYKEEMSRDDKPKPPFSFMAQETLKTNYTGTLDMCDALFPLLRPHARVVNIASIMGIWTLSKCSTQIRHRLTTHELTVSKLSGLMREFIEAAQAGTLAEGGWPEMAYGMSKLSIMALSVVQQKVFDQDEREDIVVNACCPGFVATDLNGHLGRLTIDEGAETPVYLALLPPGISDPRGRFVENKQIKSWGQE